MHVRKLCMITLFSAFLWSLGAAFGQGAPTPERIEAQALLAKFWEQYTAGEGLAYVVIKDGRGERVYRYGDVSRLAAKKEPRGFILFTCAAPHVFVVEEVADQADLLNAQVVKQGETRFAELDAKYIAGCRNPFVKSAIPRDPK